MGVPHIDDGFVFDQIPANDNVLGRHAYDCITLGMTAANMLNLHFQITQENGEFPVEHYIRPSQTRHAVNVTKQSGKAPNF